MSNSNGSKWGRLSAMRRSSVFSLGRSPPSRTNSVHERDSSDGASITKQKVDTTPAVLSPPTTNKPAPSPIKESPVTEANESTFIPPPPPGPSILGVAPVLSHSPDPADAISPVGYTPPPVVDSSIGNPGAFTDQTDEELPQPITVSDPYIPQNAESFRGAPSTRAPSIREPPAPVAIVQPTTAESPREDSSTVHDALPSAVTVPAVAESTQDPTPANNITTSPKPLSIRERPIPTTVAESPPDDVPARLPTPSYEQYTSNETAGSYFDNDVMHPIQPVSRPSEDFTRVVEEAPLGNEMSREVVNPHPNPTVPPIPVDITGIHSMSSSVREESQNQEPAAAQIYPPEPAPRMPVSVPEESLPASRTVFHQEPVSPLPVPVPDEPIQNSRAVFHEELTHPSMPVPAHEEPIPSSHAAIHKEHIPPMPVPVHEESVPSSHAGAHEEPSPPMPIPVHDHKASNGSANKTFHIMPIDDFNTGTNVWGDVPQSSSYKQTNGNGNVHHEAPGHKEPYDVNDVFDAPVAPRITFTPSDAPSLPHPRVVEPHTAPPAQNEEVQGHIIMPLHPVHEVIPARSVRDDASTISYPEHRVEFDETRPLLSIPGTPKRSSYLHPNTMHNTNVNVSPVGTHSMNGRFAAISPRLHELGWIEYHLPDGTFYYVHPTRRVTTDVNLRTEKVLSSVNTYLENIKESAPSGCELWLRDVGNSRKGFIPARSWVNHQARSVIVEDVHGMNRKGKNVEDDQLDMEYRYWSFIEGHPAHTKLPVNAKHEAFEALSWAWTDRLLPSDRIVPAPFTQEECQELNSLLRSFTNDADIIQTRLVARILRRVAIWRQAYFRPNKPLPKDVTHIPPVVGQRRPIIKSFIDFMVSVFCLGIPYIFFDRHKHRIDEESGFRTPGPMFFIGTCTCLVAAIVLSASVSFLSLPGLDNVAQTSGLIATLLASFSMVSTLVAIFKYKSDVVRGVQSMSGTGGEGFTVISNRSFIFSLPLVFLAYSIIAFIVGIIVYFIRSSTIIKNPNSGFAPYHSEPYLRWTTVSTMGALSGLFVMLFALRR